MVGLIWVLVTLVGGNWLILGGGGFVVVLGCGWWWGSNLVGGLWVVVGFRSSGWAVGSGIGVGYGL